MACTSPSYGSYVSAVNKNTLPSSVKDTNRWQQQPPHLPSHSPSPFTPPPGHFSHTLTSQKQHSNQHCTTVTNSNNPNPAHGNSSSISSNSTTALTTPTTMPTSFISNMQGNSSSSTNGTSSQSSDSRNYGSGNSSSNPTIAPSPSSDHSNLYHRQRSVTEGSSPSKGFPFPGTGRGSYKHVSDGGWAHGTPTKGSGWRGSKAGMVAGSSSSLQSPQVGTDGGMDGWNNMPDSGTSGWEGSSGNNTRMERRSVSSGIGWLPASDGRAGGGPGMPGADSEVWESVSSGQSSLNSGGGGRSVWGQCDVINEDISIGSGTSSATLTSLPSESKVGRRENGKHSSVGLPRSMSWGDSGQHHGSGSGERKSQVEGSGSQEQPARSGEEKQLSQPYNRMDDRHVSQQLGGGGCVDLSAGTGSSQGEERVTTPQQGRPSSKPEASRMEWEDLDRISVSSSEREVFGGSSYGGGGQSQESHGPSLSVASSGTGYPHPDTLSVSGGQASEQGQQQFPSARGTFINSQDGHVSSSDDSESFGGRHVSPRNSAGTPVHGRHSGSATPTQSRGNRVKGESVSSAAGTEGAEVNCWHGRRLNLSGNSSASNSGVGTGWKGDAGRGGGGTTYQSQSTSPQKPSRYERSNSTSLSYHDSTSNNDSNISSSGTTSGLTPSSVSSTSSGNGSSLGGMKGPPRPSSKVKKTVSDLGEGLDTLHCEPSGWGELPSPKNTDPDNGTEFWGIPPEDIKRQQMKVRAAHQGSHPGDTHPAWSDVPMGSGGSDWEDESPPAWFPHPDAGGHVLTPGTPGSAMMGGAMGYGEGRGLPPSTPRSGPMAMVEPGNNAWGSFPLKNKKPVTDKLLKPAGSDFDMTVMFPSPEDLGGPASAASTPAREGNLYMKDRLSHVGSKIPTTLGIGSSFEVTGGGVAGLNLSQDGGSMHQLNAMTPSSTPNSQSQDQRLQWLQLQQQYLLNQIQLSGSTPVPSQPLNLQNFQQVLSQQLAHFQKQHQQLLQQVKLASSMGGGGGMSSTQHHQISLKLKQTQQAIQQINSQLALISQLSFSASSTGSQPKAPSPKSQELASFGSAQVPQGTGMKHPGRSHSTSSMMTVDEGHETKNLMFGLQGLTIGSGAGGYGGGSVGGQNSRSTSRLHQIISGSSSSNESLVGGGGSQGSMSSGGGSQVSSPFSPPLGGSGIPSYSSGNEMPPPSSSAFGVAGTPSNPASSPFLSGGKFNEIQEFKPGVPWQPRNQGTDQSSAGQHLPKHSKSGGRMGDSYAQSPGSYGSSPGVDLGSGAGMGFSSRSFQSGGRGGSSMSHKYGRSNSTGGGLYQGMPGNGGGAYLGGGGGSGNGFGKKQVPSPVIVNKYSIHYGPGNNQRSDGHQGGGGGGGSGWGSTMSHDPSTATSPFGNASHTQMRSYYPGRGGNQGNAPSPVNVMGQSSNWKVQSHHHQQQQQFPAPPGGSRRIAPPSSLPPRASGAGYGSSKSIGGTPIGSSFYGGSSALSSVSSFSSVPSEDKKWGGYPSTPSANTPSSGMISNSIWGSGSSSDEPHSVSSRRGHWDSAGAAKDDQDGSRGWSEMDMASSSSSMGPARPPGFAMNRRESTSSTSPAFEPTHSTTGTALDEQGCATTSPAVTTPSFASGNTWGLEGRHKDMFGPDPSFAEWQAGKKARLSISKPSSNMATSPWLIMHNVSSQVSQTSVKELCSKYGRLVVCYVHQQSEFCLICYSNIEEAIQAKATLDKSPSINGVLLTVDFASESAIKDICEQLQVRLVDNKQQQEEEGPKHQSWGFSPVSQPNPTSQPKPSLPSFSTSSQWGDGPSAQAPPTGLSGSSSLENSGNANSNGNSSNSNTGSLFNRQSSELSTPGSSSMWSDPGFLSGLSSPWQSSFSSSGAISGGSGGNSGPFSLTSPQPQQGGSTEASSFPSVNNSNASAQQPFLPNGLF